MGLGKVAKAIFAGIVGFVSPLVVVMVGDASFGDITDGQWLASVLAAVIGAGGVYGITNSPPS